MYKFIKVFLVTLKKLNNKLYNFRNNYKANYRNLVDPKLFNPNYYLSKISYFDFNLIKFHDLKFFVHKFFRESQTPLFL